MQTVDGYLTNITAIAAGSRFSLALDSSGNVWGWGDNDDYQIGDVVGREYERTYAVKLGTISDVEKMVAGDSFALVQKTDGTVWYWGQHNSENAFLNGGGTQTPVQVSGVTSPDALVAGGGKAGAIMPDGTIRMWRYGYEGQLGNNTTGWATSYVNVKTPDGSGEFSLGSSAGGFSPSINILLLGN